MELQLVSARSLDVKSGLSRRYVFHGQTWLDVENEDDWSWLLVSSPALLRSRVSLADRHLIYTGARPLKLDLYSETNEPFQFKFMPGHTYRFDDTNGRMLTRSAGNRFHALTLTEWLSNGGDGTVLILRGGGLGDLLLLTPALRELKQQWPHCNVSLACSPYMQRALLHNPNVDQLTNRRHAYSQAPYDFLADLEGYVERSPKTATVSRSLLFAQALGLTALSDLRLDYTIEDTDRTWAKQVLQPLREGKRPLIAVQPHGSNPARHPRAHLMCKAIAAMLEQGWNVVTLGSQTPAEGWGASLDLCGQTDVGQAGGIIDAADAYFGMDSGLTHLANALDKPTVALYGPIHPDLRVAGQTRCEALTAYDRVGCDSCADSRHPECREAPRCLEAIRTETIIAALQRSISGNHAG